MKTVLTFFMLVLVFASGCGEPQHACFDQQLYKDHKDAFCTADCPGVIGCDGKHYCNACEAARVGIEAH